MYKKLSLLFLLTYMVVLLPISNDDGLPPEFDKAIAWAAVGCVAVYLSSYQLGHYLGEIMYQRGQTAVMLQEEKKILMNEQSAHDILSRELCLKKGKWLEQQKCARRVIECRRAYEWVIWAEKIFDRGYFASVVNGIHDPFGSIKLGYMRDIS